MLMFFVSAISASAIMLQNYEDLCHAELGVQSSVELRASQIFLFRRCVNLKRIEAEKEKQFEQILQRYDQKFWKRYDIGQEFLERSRRTLKEQLRRRQK